MTNEPEVYYLDAEQARQVKMLTAMELFSSTGVWGLLDTAEISECDSASMEYLHGSNTTCYKYC